MFVNFQFCPRPIGANGDHPLNGAHADLVGGHASKFGWRAASDVSFSQSIKTDAAIDLTAVEASETAYQAQLPLPSLSPREKEVLVWAGRGKSAWETAQLLDLSESTVKSYIRNACGRLGVKNKTHAVAICLTHGLFRI